MKRSGKYGLAPGAGVLAAGLLVGLSAGAALAAETTVRMAPAPPAGHGNDFYTGNRAPLAARRLIKLPIGSIRPEGWVRRQLELMADGFTGHLPEVSRFCHYDGSAWTTPGGAGKFGWEEVPYWLRGFFDLGLILNDDQILGQAKRWVEAVLASQRPDGYFGSRENLRGEHYRFRILQYPHAPDLWPNMVMLYPLRSLYEATGDKRVLAFMTKYFQWQSRIPIEDLLPMTWARWRAGDNLDSIYWLYNRTGEGWLLDLARVNHERTADWTGGIPTWHVVNIAECFREPGQFYQQTHDVRYLKATERNYDLVRGIYGQVPGGMYAGDENARPGFTGPRQGTETCAMVEMMHSAEMLLGITGNPVWADRAEDVAFNSLPAAMTPDLKGLHYLTAPNLVQLTRTSKSPMLQNGGDMLSYNPHQYRCCQHNVSFGWPYFAEHLWMATPDNGLSPVFYAASKVTAKVGDGTEVSITESTDYPFGETVTFQIAAPKPVRFPLTLRIPRWCENPAVSVNGKPVKLPRPARGWAIIERRWHSGDEVRLELPMKITTTLWANNRNTMSVHRGPLSFSLKIGERWERKGGTDKWPGYEVLPATPWNYGLVVDESNPAASFQVVQRKGALAPQPFTVDDAPILLRARGKRIPEWGLEPNGLIEEVQPGPVRSNEPVGEITLIPMGCARLRISSFPVIGEGADARRWKENVPLAMASYSTYLEPPAAMNDGLAPRSSADRSIPRFTWSSYKGVVGYWERSRLTGAFRREASSGHEWVEYLYSRPIRASACEVYWVDEQVVGGPCRLPASWRLLWRDGERWRPVENTTAYETMKDAFSRVEFQPVETMGLRIEVELQRRRSGGILEWRVLE